MTPPSTPEQGIPADLLRQVEDDVYLDSCDWGMCRQPTHGFGYSDSDPAEEWVTICHSCSKGLFPPESDEPFPVDRFISLVEIRRALEARS